MAEILQTILNPAIQIQLSMIRFIIYQSDQSWACQKKQAIKEPVEKLKAQLLGRFTLE